MSGLSHVPPEHGGRVVLRRSDVSGERANYAIELLTPEHRYNGTARVVIADGRVELEAPDEAPEWLLSLTKTLLRGAWRSSNVSGFPRRLTRWREAPKA